MARARMIKPDIAFDEHLCDCTAEERLLYVFLPTIADKDGIIEYVPKRMKAMLFPYDDIDIDKCIYSLRKVKLTLYENNGNLYLIINNWNNEQNPHKFESESKYPKPNDNESILHTYVRSPTEDLRRPTKATNACSSTKVLCMSTDSNINTSSCVNTSSITSSRKNDDGLLDFSWSLFPTDCVEVYEKSEHDSYSHFHKTIGGLENNFHDCPDVIEEGYRWFLAKTGVRPMSNLVTRCRNIAIEKSKHVVIAAPIVTKESREKEKMEASREVIIRCIQLVGLAIKDNAPDRIPRILDSQQIGRFKNGPPPVDEWKTLCSSMKKFHEKYPITEIPEVWKW